MKGVELAGFVRAASAGSAIVAVLTAIVPAGLARPVAAQVAVPVPVIGAGASASAFELTFWQSVAASDDPAQLDAYLAAYPNGAFSQLARLKIAALRSRQVGVPAPATPAVPGPLPGPATASTSAPVDSPAPAVAATGAVPLTTNPAVVSQPAPTAVIAIAPAAAPVSAPAPTLAEQLRLLASGQGTTPGETATASGGVPAGVAVPAAPVLTGLPELRLPAQFCSAEARNLYYDSEYKPAMELADRNNQAAIAHLQELQGLYDQRGRAGDIAGQNNLAAAAREYGPVAAEAFRARSAYDAIFNRLLAVPIRPCAATGS